MLILRESLKNLASALQQEAIVLLLGPHQAGKTTLALQYAEQNDSVYFNLQLPESTHSLTHPQVFFDQYKDRLVILDEIHRVPKLFPVLRELVDQTRRERPGRFLLLGSATVTLLQKNTESLDGRVKYIYFPPLCLSETTEESLTRLWLRGGFPPSFCSPNYHESLIWRRNFIRTYIERYMPQLVPRLPYQLIERLLVMLAHNHGTILNASNLAVALEVSSPTVMRYVVLLEELFLIRLLRPFVGSLNKRLVKSPKVFIRDSGLLHTLLNLPSFDRVMQHPVCGFSWEGFVIEQICTLLDGHATCLYYRTADGAEIDLLIEWLDSSDLWAIEIKMTLARSVSKGFLLSVQVLGTQRNFVVCQEDRSTTSNSIVDVFGVWDFLKLLRQRRNNLAEL